MAHRRTELPSGVRVLTERLEGQRSVAIGAWIATGSRFEPAEVCGTTHFLEHLLFKGTPTRSALRIAQDFDSSGGDLNAFTTKEFTCFHARLVPEDLTLGVDTIADMLQHATLTAEDVESERNVVLEEIAMHEDAPDDIIFDLFHETIWPGHALGRRVQGYSETIAAIGRDAIADFYRGHYVPRATVVAAAGDVEHDQVVDLVARAYEAAGPGARPMPAGDPVMRGALAISERDVEQAHVAYGTDGIPRGDDRRWALGVLNVALGGGMSSRLFQEIRERRGLAYNVASGHQGFSDTGVFSVYVGCSPDNVGEIMRIVRDQIDAIVADGITEEEWRRALGHMRGSLVLSLDDAGALMSHIGKSELLMPAVPTVDEMLARVEAVTLRDVQDVARDVLGTGPWSLAILGPKVGADVSGFVREAA